MISYSFTFSVKVPLELLGTVSKPGDYILIVHYYMPTERGLDIPITLFDDGQAYLGHYFPFIAICYDIDQQFFTLRKKTHTLCSKDGLNRLA